MKQKKIDGVTYKKTNESIEVVDVDGGETFYLYRPIGKRDLYIIVNDYMVNDYSVMEDGKDNYKALLVRKMEG